MLRALFPDLFPSKGKAFLYALCFGGFGYMLMTAYPPGYALYAPFYIVAAFYALTFVVKLRRARTPQITQTTQATPTGSQIARPKASPESSNFDLD